MSEIIINYQDLVANRRPRVLTMLRRGSSTLRPFFKRMLIVVLCGVLAAIADLLSIGLLFPLLQSIVGREAISAFPSLPNIWILETLSSMSMETRLRWLLGGMLLIQIAKESIVYINLVYITHVHAILAQTVRVKVLDRILALPLSIIQSVPSGHHYTVVSSFSQNAADVVLIGLKMVVPIVAIFASTAVMFYLSPVLTAIALASVVIVAITITSILSRQQRLFAQLNDIATDMNHRTFELFTAMRTIRLFNRENFMKEKQIQIVRRYWETSTQSMYLSQLVGPITQVLTIASAVAIFMLGLTVFKQDGIIWTETILLYLYVIARLAAPAAQLNSLRSEYAAKAPAADLIAELLKADPAPVTASHHNSYRLNSHSISGSMRFENVSFRYNPDGPDVLKAIEITIPEKEVTAIVGASGAGKSTLVDLMVRLRRPSSGRILFGTTDLSDVADADVRSQVALVPQDPFLFSGSIRDNILFGNPEASNDEVQTAVESANLIEAISSLPDGLDTQLGERGTRLSGGQIQRVAIARAIITNPSVLILDEATSAQDAESERAIRDAIKRLSRTRTIVVIAHRLATVREADRIIVLDNGQVTETGTHADLIALGGRYARYVELQDLRG